MLYWKNVPPAIALNYFYKEYASHPTTAKFAAKTLQRFKPVRYVFSITYIRMYEYMMCVTLHVIYYVHVIIISRMKFCSLFHN